MFLAFRLYGDFHWPPNAGKPVAAAERMTRLGAIEVHIASRNGQSAQHALLRWVPRDQFKPDPPAEPEPPTQSIFDLTAEQWFAENETGGAIWLSKGAAETVAQDPTWVILRGAFLFEQYGRKDAEGKETSDLDLQWPLVTQCEYDKGNEVYSVLGIRRSAKPLMYFNFHLPLPVRRTSLADSTPANSSFFPFCAVFDLTPSTREKLIAIDTLFGGWQQDDLLPAPKADDYPCFVFKDDSNPKTMRLGEFGFSEYGETAGTEFAVYGLSQDDTGKYWPLNRQSLLQDILWRYGFALDYDQTGWLMTANAGLADSSLRFVRPHESRSSGRGNRSSLIYRTSVVQTGAAPSESDLQTDGERLRLRLRDELGGRRAHGTQFGANDTSTDVELADQIEGWLQIGKSLSTDCELSWEIAPQDIWTRDRSTDWAMTVAVRLHWRESVAQSDVTAAPALPQPAHGSTAHDFKAGLLAQANFTFDVVRASLEPGEAGRPHSFLPELSVVAAKEIRFALYGSPLPAEFKDDRVIAWGRPAPTEEDESPPWQRPPMRLSLAGVNDVIPNVKETFDELILAGAKTTFFQEDPALTLTLSHDPSWPPQSTDTIEDSHPFFASFKLDARPTQEWRGRLASLQFSGIEPEPIEGDAEQHGHIRIGGRGAHLGLGRGAPILAYPNGRIAAEIRLAIPAAKVEPVGVDVARGDRSGRPGPLLIPLGIGSKATANLFWLTATETLSPTHDRLLEATVTENSQETGSRSYVVLASEPFSIFRFTHQPLYGRGQADAATVAFYSGDDRIWQYRQIADFYHYVFPPQSIGESADKPRRLEIHDLPDGSEEIPPRPFSFPVDENAKPLEVDRHRRVVEFRLTPSAEIWIRPSDVQRGYFMPESTSYEIFRQPGEYGLGVALAYLRAEFLYGLSVGIDVSKERSIARGARIAEIEALTGRLTGPARETDAEARLAHRWDAVRSAVARRPERLEIWARDLDSAIDFTPARFTDGVQFALRHTALHRAAVLDPAPDKDKDEGLTEVRTDFTSPPRIAGLLPSSVPRELETNPRHHPQGLSGGALWPVESLNLFRTLLQAPQSNGGAIESIALSPIGGDATQKAEFLGGKVTIISETRNGYVERQQVEVLGRICAFWHRAKHVVVYERTVNPSAQFAPKLKEDRNRTRSRRPILRKVREYIELLQPERNYPDFGTAAQRSAGFLERVRFNSKIINVDSAWASEVDKFAWEIPLWNRLSARERPQVYPMPDVAFVSTAEGDGEKPVVAQECLDPDYLFFFADFSTATTADTDTWVSRLNLDFPNMPMAREITAKVDAKSSEQPKEHDGQKGFPRRRPSVGRILPGLRRFTWRLAPAAQKTAINAGRAKKPVYAGLDSVTFMRATHTTDVPKELAIDHPLIKVLDITAKFPAGGASEAVSALQYWDSKGNNTAFKEAGEFSTKLDALTKTLEGNDLTALNKARKELAGQWKEDFRKGLKKTIPGDLSDFGGFVSGLKAAPSFCGKLASDAIEMIQRKEMLIRSALEDWNRQSGDFVTEAVLFANGATKENAIAELQKRAIDYIRPLFDEASKDIGKVEEGVEKSRAALIDLEAEVEAVIERARQRIAEFVNGYDHAAPWSPERRQAFRAGISACVGNVSDDISAAIEETRQRLGVELNEVSQAIGGHVAKALKAISTTEAEATAQVGSLQGVADGLYFKIDKTLARLQDDAKSADLDKLIADVQALNPPPALKTEILAALQKLKDACAATKKAIAGARKAAADVDRLADESAEDLKTLTAVLGKTLKDSVQDVAAPAKEVVDFAAGLANTNAAAIAEEFKRTFGEIDRELQDIAAWPDAWIKQIGTSVDAVVKPAAQFLDTLLGRVEGGLRGIPEDVLPVIDDVKQALQAAQDALAPNALLEGVVAKKIIGPALALILEPLPAAINAQDVEKTLVSIKSRLELLSGAIEKKIRDLSEGMLDALDQVSKACSNLAEGVADVETYFSKLAGNAQDYFDSQLDAAYGALEEKLGKLDQDLITFPKDAAGLIKAAQSFDRSVRSLQNNLSRAHETARMYGDRVFNQFSKLGDGGILAAPSNILKLYSAVTTAPEIAALKADIDRIRAGFDELSDIVETTKANALFNRLGDELKALGLSLPFDKISDRLLPADLSSFDIGKVFRNFGGTKLDNLLKGYKIPAGVSDAVRVTHDFDKKQARAWVQVDIDAPMPGRRSLFSVGVFKADFVDMRLTGQVRLEASKDTDKVTETGHGRVGTVIDLVVGGQSMVRFEKFGLNLTREKGLDIEFDPKNIRLNPSFKFIQDFLSSLFPDDIGGLQVIKQNGIPVGVQHDFAIPPLSLNFATSGVSNISISNHFKLLAFPDFMLANRFNLSTVERPFIFSIFIIGGTGYIQIDAEYRPFDSELMVSVEAGAGGSASLAFAFGPFVGQVFITLSGALTYRKVIGKSGGGLSISAILVIAGHVDVAGIITVGIVLVLRMTYRDNGQIDADGSLSVTIRISRFFKITARANVKYKLRGGKSETVVTTDASAEITDQNVQNKVNQVKAAANKLEKARN